MKISLVTIAPEVNSLGMVNIAAYLKEHGYDPTLMNVVAPYMQSLGRDTLEQIVSHLTKNPPDVLGVSVTTHFFEIARDISDELREKLPSLTIVWGGIHPTIQPEECLEHCDVLCVGEGEEATLELVRRLERGESYNDIANLWVRDNVFGQIHRNGVRRLVEDLDTRPFPYFDWESDLVAHGGTVEPLTKANFNRFRPKMGTVYEIMATRGCPFSCSFCCNSTFNAMYRGKGKLLRYRSAEHVIAELEYVMREFPDVRAINFEDDALGSASEKYLERLCTLYKERIGLPFHIRIIPTYTIKERKIAMLADAGLVGAVMGLQGSDEMNEVVYKRPTTQKTFIDVANMLHRYKVIGRYDVIINNPYSQEKDEVEAIETFLQIPKPYHLYTYSLGFFPHTDLTKRAMEDGHYDITHAGYDYIYGAEKKDLYPKLARLIEMTPYTPRFIVRSLLKHRDTRLGSLAIRAYSRLIYRPQRWIFDRFILRNANYLLFLRRVIFGATRVRRSIENYRDYKLGAGAKT